MKPRAPGIVIGSLALVAGVWAAASLRWPFQADHGVYAWIGDVVLHGGMPYRDAWDVKGPAALLPSLIAQVVFGRNMWGLRVLDLIMVSLAAVSIFRILRRWCGPTGAMLPALCWVLVYASVGFTATAQPDGFWAMLLLASVVPLTAGALPSARATAMAGACIAGLALLKPIYLAFLVLPILANTPARPGERFRYHSLAWLAAGFALPVAATLVWLQAGGALGAFFDAYISFNAAKNSAHLLRTFVSAVTDGMAADPVWLMLVAAAAAGSLLIRTEAPRATRVLGAWIVIGLIVVHLQRPYNIYRPHIVSPPVVLLAGYAFARAVLAGGAGRAMAYAFGAAIVFLVARPPLVAALAPRPYQVLSSTAEGLDRVVDLTTRNTRPGEPIFAFRHPAIYFLAERPAVSRISIRAATGAGAPPRYITAHLAELGRALSDAMPRLIILPDPGTSAEACLGCFEPLSAMPETAATLAPRYRLLQRADGIAVFMRRDSLEPR